jgi:hypothetical protein
MSSKPSLGILKDLIPQNKLPKKTTKLPVPVPVPVPDPVHVPVPAPVHVPVPAPVHVPVPAPVHVPVPPKRSKAKVNEPLITSVSFNSGSGNIVSVSSINSNSQTSTKEVKSSSRSSSKLEKKTKIGSYASAEFQNWLSTPIQKPKIKRSKKTNDDAYQVFQDFADMVDNPDWKAFFQKLYSGKFPHGYSYRSQTLFFRKRTKIEKLEILDSTKSTMTKVMQFFIVYGGYSNDKDDVNIFDIVVLQTPKYENWKDIRSKKTKQFFILKYIDELAANHELSDKEKMELVDTIHTGFLLKTIDGGDIEFQNKRITNIKTLEWDNEHREFVIPNLHRIVKNSRKTVSEKVQKNTFSSHWNKFVSHIHKSKNQNPGEDIATDASTTLEDLTDSELGSHADKSFL